MVLEKSKIEEKEKQLIEAIKTSEISFLESILHDELLFIAPNGQLITKKMDLESHKAKQMVVEYLLPSFEEIKIIGDTAIVVVVYDTKGTMLSNPIEGKFKYIRIWKYIEGSLKIIAGSCTRI